MIKPSKNRSDKSNFVPIITAILALVGTMATAYFGYKAAYNSIWIPIITTQTAEARQATQWTGQSILTPTISPPTETLTEIPPTQVVVIQNTPDVPTLLPASPIPSLCCLAGWDIFSSDGRAFTPLSSADCSNVGVAELGIHTSDCGLVFGINDLKQRGVYGLSIPIPYNSSIKVSVSITTLIEGELWLGFSSSVDPQNGSLIYAMTPDPGGVFVFLNDISSARARYSWAPMGEQIDWVKGQPRRYDFEIKLDGNKAAVEVNSVTFTTEVALSTARLFLGYRSKPAGIGTYINATVTDLIITHDP